MDLESSAYWLVLLANIMSYYLGYKSGKKKTVKLVEKIIKDNNTIHPDEIDYVCIPTSVAIELYRGRQGDGEKPH
jgi:hypothetical protein